MTWNKGNTNIEAAKISILNGDKTLNKQSSDNYYRLATTYALIAIAETLAEINEKMAEPVEQSIKQHVVYTPPTE